MSASAVGFAVGFAAGAAGFVVLYKLARPKLMARIEREVSIEIANASGGDATIAGALGLPVVGGAIAYAVRQALEKSLP